MRYLCNLCFLILLFFAYFGPVGALFLLFLFEKSKYFLFDEDAKAEIKKRELSSTNIIEWSMGWVIVSILFIFVIMPFMGNYETRYIMAIMPFVSVLSMWFLIKLGTCIKIKDKYWYVLLISLIICNSVATNFGEKSVFRFRNTQETIDFMGKVKGKDVFVLIHERASLLFFENGYYLKDANRVYVETELSDENLINAIKENGDEMFFLLLEQNANDVFWGKPTFFDKNPRMNDVLEFISKVTFSERGYDLYKIKKGLIL